MTMHLAQGLSTISTKKRKTKITKARLIELQDSWRKHNKEMKQKGMHDMRYEKFDDYLDYCYGRKKVDTTKFRPQTHTQVYRREDDHRTKYPSVPLSAVDNGSCRKIEPQRYTGTLVKGIATMHKSNAVPVIDDQHAKDISRMRR